MVELVYPTGDPESLLDDTGKIVFVDNVGTPGVDCDFNTIEEAANYLYSLPGKRGGVIALHGGQNHDISTVVDIRGFTIESVGQGRPVVRQQPGGRLLVGGNRFSGVAFDVSAVGFFLDISENAQTDILGVDFRPTVAGAYIFGASVPGFVPTLTFRLSGQSNQAGGIIDPAAVFAFYNIIITGTNQLGTLQFGARNVTADTDARYDTTGQITGIPIGHLTCASGENINSRLASLAAIGGGVLELLPGVHLVTEPVYVLGNNISVVGSGEGTIIRALAGTWNPAYLQGGNPGLPNNGQDAVVCVGRYHLPLVTFPEIVVTGVEISGIVVESSVPIHGYYVHGGKDNRIEGCSAKALAQLIYPGSWACVGFLATDSLSAPGSRLVFDDCVVESISGSTWYCDAYHIDGGAPGGFSGIYGFGNRITDSAIIESAADSCYQTVYELSFCDDSTCYICQGRDVPIDVNGIVLGVLNCVECSFIDVTAVNPLIGGAIAAYVYASTLCNFLNNFISGTVGATWAVGIYVFNSSQCEIGRNFIKYATVGVQSLNGSTDCVLGPNTYNNVATPVTDAGTTNKFVVKAAYGTGNPNGVLTTRFGDEFYDSAANVYYKQYAYPQGSTWRAI